MAAAGRRLPPYLLLRWVADKLRSGLSVDSTEQTALTDVLSRWPNVPVTVTPAAYSPAASHFERARTVSVWA